MSCSSIKRFYFGQDTCRAQTLTFAKDQSVAIHENKSTMSCFGNINCCCFSLVCPDKTTIVHELKQSKQIWQRKKRNKVMIKYCFQWWTWTVQKKKKSKGMNIPSSLYEASRWPVWRIPGWNTGSENILHTLAISVCHNKTPLCYDDIISSHTLLDAVRNLGGWLHTAHFCTTHCVSISD